MNALFEPYGLSTMEAAIVELWEFQPNVLLIFCASTKHEKNAVSKESGVVNNTFIWDTQQGTIRESQFTLPPERQDLQVDIVGTPALSMFRTFYFMPGKAVQAPAYFISNAKEAIVHEEKWVCSHLQKYAVLERSSETIVEGCYDNVNVSELRIRTIGLFVRREISMFLLREMKDLPKNCLQGWDSDLVRDIFSRLDYQESQ